MNPFKFKPSVLISAVLYQVSWAVLIFLGSVWVPVVFVGFFVAHYVFVCRSFAGWQATLLFATCGLGVDCLLAVLGIYEFTQPIPVWLAVLWLVFSASVPHAFGFLLKNRLLAGLLGGIAAPMSYWVAIEARSDVAFGEYLGEYGLIVVGLYWGVLMQLAISLYEVYSPYLASPSSSFKKEAKPSMNLTKSSKV